MLGARGSDRGGASGSSRGQSSVLGIALLLGITALGLTAIVVIGGGALTESENAVAQGSAEQAMLEFDSRASLVAHGDSQSQRATLTSGKGQVSVHPGAGWMNVTVHNETTGEVETKVMNATLGAVVFQHNGRQVAYQGGGVWQKSEGGSVVLSPPELHYQDTTLTMPLVTVGGDRSLDGRVRISRKSPPIPRYPNVSAGRTNPLREGIVNVTVHSEYYRAWGSFFRQRFNAQVTYYHAKRVAKVQLLVPETETQTVESALSSAAPDGNLKLSGSGNYPAFTDSYNSSKGNYTVSKSSNGTISTSGSVEVSGNARVNGTVRAGGAVKLEGTSKVTDFVYWTTGFSASGSAEYEGESQISGVSGKGAITSKVRNKVDELKETNDNGNTTAISNNRFDFGGGDSLTLSPGEYYLDRIDLDSKNVTVETNGNLVLIGVANDVKLDDSSNITVKGSGSVRIYTLGNIDIRKGSSVHVPGDRSAGFWLYGTEEADITLEGSSSRTVTYDGVIYAPSPGGDADLTVKHARVFGSLVAGEMTIGTGGAVHYDQALKTADPFPTTTSLPKVTYLHVSINRVNVTDV